MLDQSSLNTSIASDGSSGQGDMETGQTLLCLMANKSTIGCPGNMMTSSKACWYRHHSVD